MCLIPSHDEASNLLSDGHQTAVVFCFTSKPADQALKPEKPRVKKTSLSLKFFCQAFYWQLYQNTKWSKHNIPKRHLVMAGAWLSPPLELGNCMSLIEYLVGCACTAPSQRHRNHAANWSGKLHFCNWALRICFLTAGQCIKRDSAFWIQRKVERISL